MVYILFNTQVAIVYGFVSGPTGSQSKGAK
jgi:hypothetical protein